MSETADLTEKELGEFRLLRRLGGGGMADVYLAEQTSLGRYVALKVMRKDLMSGSDDVMLKRFRQEAMMAAGLNHANIVQVYTIGEEDGVHYIAQEYVQGKNLAQLLKSKGGADINSALHIMRQVGSALKASGNAGIVHRDIKPENIMLTKRGEVKITDFGLAQLNEKKKDGGLTQVGMTLGTPLYMSPEQVQGADLDPRTDIYSFGVTCYHMLSGAPPYTGTTPMAIAVQHVNNTPEPLQKRRPELPMPVCRLVHRMMAKKPDERYQTAEAVLQDIRKLANALKSKQDLNLVRLPNLNELDRKFAVAEIPGAEPPRKASSKPRKSSSQRGSSGSASAMPTAAVATPGRPAKQASSPSPAPPKPKPRDLDEEDDGFTLRGAETEFEDMDLTPMVDVTFLLLIFFMITASFTLQKSMEVPAPDPNDGASTQPVTDEMFSDSVQVQIDENNVIRVEDVEVRDSDDLVNALKDKMVNEQKTELMLEADPLSTHGVTIMVFDAAQEVGMQKIRQKLSAVD